jgi:hypothetical protein
MAKRPEDIEDIAQSGRVVRDSDNPVVEEFKDDLLSKPSFGIRPAPDEDARILRLEAQLAEMRDKVEELEKRILAMEGRK